MKYNGLCVGIVEQVEEFFRTVTVVGVDRRKPALEGRVVGLEVFGAIVEEGRDFGLMVQSRGDQVGGEGVGPGVELAPGDDSFPLNMCRIIGLRAGDRLPDIGEGPGRHGNLSP